MLRIEFEQTLAANEQTGPINREMRHLITSLQTHTKQLKDENARTKKKLKEVHLENGRLRVVIEAHGLRVVTHGLLLPSDPLKADSCSAVDSKTGGNFALKTEQQQQQQNQHSHPHHSEAHSSSSAAALQQHSDSSNDGALVMASEGDLKSDHPSSSPLNHLGTNATSSSSSSMVKKEEPSPAMELELTVEPSELADFFEQGPPEKDSLTTANTANSTSAAAAAAAVASAASSLQKLAEAERQIRELKAQLKKATEERRELKLLLDGYRLADKDKR